MNGREMQERVLQHYRRLTLKNPGYYPVRMAELAPGVVAVEDGAGGCSVLFDPEQWQPTYTYLGALMTKGIGLGVLYSVMSGATPVRTIKDMAVLAKDRLSQKRSQVWHDAPQFFYNIMVRR